LRLTALIDNEIKMRPFWRKTNDPKPLKNLAKDELTVARAVKRVKKAAAKLIEAHEVGGGPCSAADLAHAKKLVNLPISAYEIVDSDPKNVTFRLKDEPNKTQGKHHGIKSLC